MSLKALVVALHSAQTGDPWHECLAAVNKADRVNRNAEAEIAVTENKQQEWRNENERINRQYRSVFGEGSGEHPRSD
jgi:hypothetical protein